MTPSRWQPLSDLLRMQRTMERMLEDQLLGTSGTEGGAGSFPIDVHDTGDAFELDAPLPGVKPEDIEVNTTGNAVSIRAELHHDREHVAGGSHEHERAFGSFQRVLSLPTEIDTAKVEANYEHGVLRLRLPKSESVKPRRVQIRSGGTAKAIETQMAESTRIESKPAESQMAESKPVESQTGDGNMQRHEEPARPLAETDRGSSTDAGV